MISTHTLAPDTINAIGMVGQVVTYGGAQYKIHCVEGASFYAYDHQGSTTVDFGLTPAAWLQTPLATLLPSGARLGEGRSVEVPVTSPYLRRGVCLTKSYA